MFPVLAGNNPVSTGYNLTRSLRTRSSATAYLNRTPATTTNRQTWTWSCWVKRGTLGSFQRLFGAVTNANDETNGIRFNSSDQLDFIWITTGASTITGRLITTQVFRDPSAWYHIVLAVDTTQATAANRFKLYINGTQVTAFGTATYPSQNDNGYVNQASVHRINAEANGSSPTQTFDGYTAEANFVDGSQLTPSSFGSTNSLTGVWQAARYTGSYGTNGWYENFTDNSALTTSSNVGLGKDFSGNGNYFVTNNISITAGINYDSMTDVPTLTSSTAANYATWNPLDFSASPVFSLANLQVGAAASTFRTRSTMALPIGVKTYVEIYQTGTAASVDVYCGLLSSNAAFPSFHANPGVNWYASDTIYGLLNGASTFSFAGTLAAGAILQIAYDGSTGKVWLGINNTWYTSAGATSGNPSAGTGEFATLSTGTSWSVYCGSSTGAQYIIGKFGQNGQSYTPPTGFVALNTYNLPTSTIVKGNTVMDATLYTGAGNTSSSITNSAGFKPDLVWMKARSIAYNHYLYDSVRGTGTSKSLNSNTTSAEGADASKANLSSFDSTGWTIGTTSGTNALNASGQTFVGWQWQAGQGSTSSNTDGTITSTVSVNASAGFSVATFSGASGGTVGHGLGVAPQIIFIKSRTTSTGWYVYTSTIGANGWLVLETTAAAVTGNPAAFGGTPTSTVWTYGAGLAGTGNYVAYCWTPIAGFSAFGSYTGNGSADGVFVYTGFRPRWIMTKQSSGSGQSWNIFDTARNTYNLANTTLYADQSSAEDSVSNAYDILSNGFKLRTAASQGNTNGATYVYMAFAETPFKNSLAR
jgi:hypothetical protein